MELLFSYGTLQLERVQLATFGRLLAGQPDVLTGFELKPLPIMDQQVIEISGKAEHQLATFTGRDTDTIAGTVYALTAEEIDSADNYEVEPCKRISMILASGTRAWVYIDGRYPPRF